jgi:large subunit ribosomal protein L7/L12
MDVNLDTLLSTFENMRLSELAEFRKMFEDKFDVTADVPLPAITDVIVPPEEPADEQTEFTIMLESAGDKKIQVIKEIRVLTGLGLKESKDLAEAAPVKILERVPKEKAEAAEKIFKAAGAVVTMT